MVIGLCPVEKTGASACGVRDHADNNPVTASEAIIFKYGVLLTPLKPDGTGGLFEDLVAITSC